MSQNSKWSSSSKHYFYLLIVLFLWVYFDCFKVSAADLDTSTPGTIRVVMDNNYPPYVFLDSEGAIQGILVDQWRLWQKKTGIRVEIKAMDWKDALKGMKAEEFDVIDTVFITQERLGWLDFGKPYSRIEVPAFFNNEISGITDVNSLKGFIVAVKEGDAAIDLLRSHGIDNLVLFKGYEAIIQAAKEHKVNVFVIDKPPALYFLYKYGIQKKYNASLPLNVGEFHRAVKKGNTALLKEIESGFAQISLEELQQIDKKWYGTPLLNFVSVKYLLVVTGVPFFLILILFYWNRSLRMAVKKRTSELEISEEELQKSEAQYRELVENANSIILRMDSKGRISFFNEFAQRFFGYQASEVIGKNVVGTIVPETDTDGKNLQAMIADIGLRPNHYATNENENMRRDGRRVWISWTNKPYYNTVSEVSEILCVGNDITDRKRAEDALRESEEKFSLTFKSSPDAVNINRLDNGLCIDINDAFTRTTGFTRDEVIGKTSLELNIWQDPADRQRLVQGLREKGFFENLEAQFRMKDGSLITGLMSARVISLKGVPHIISIARDITELKKHEEEQLKIEKLESLGVLAGGIAHDFNNILTGIMGNISFAKIFLDSAHKSYKPLAEAEIAAVRAGDLAHQLLTFSRGGEPIKKVVSLQHLVNEALSFVLHGSNVKGTVDIPDPIHAIEADEGQISQVIHNLIINATQAMPGGGILTVTAQNAALDNNNVLSLPPGSYVRLIFTDQGCGISDNDLKKIFDPYFTTKSAGIGLGLSSVHSIVSRHGGHIGVSSVVGKGTTFTIYLPSIGKVYTKYQEDVVEQAIGEHKGGHILIMDDEEIIRNIASSMLTHLGYEVTVCANGEEAIELYKTSMESGVPFLMVIMDLTIPGGLGGKQAAEQILSLFPKAFLVVSSGYSNDPIMSNYHEYGFSWAIAKPYTIHNFKEVLGLLLINR